MQNAKTVTGLITECEKCSVHSLTLQNQSRNSCGTVDAVAEGNRLVHHYDICVCRELNHLMVPNPHSDDRRARASGVAE